MKGIDFETVDEMLSCMKDNKEFAYTGMTVTVHNDQDPCNNGEYRLLDAEIAFNIHGWVKNKSSSISNNSDDISMKINKHAVVKTITKFEELKKEMNSDRYIPNNVCGLKESEWDLATLKSTMNKLLDLLDEMVRE